jgi:hypothetical protein
VSTHRFVLWATLAFVSAALVGDAGAAQTRRSKSKAARGRQSRAAKAVPAWPSFETRHADFLRHMEETNATGSPAPDPLTQYLVGEVVVTGLFETDEGMGAFLLALPSGNTFFATPGARLYNGTLEEIAGGREGYLDDIRVVFTERAAARGGAERLTAKRVEGPPPKPAPEPTPAPAPAAVPEGGSGDRPAADAIRPAENTAEPGSQAEPAAEEPSEPPEEH